MNIFDRIKIKAKESEEYLKFIKSNRSDIVELSKLYKAKELDPILVAIIEEEDSYNILASFGILFMLINTCKLGLVNLANVNKIEDNVDKDIKQPLSLIDDNISELKELILSLTSDINDVINNGNLTDGGDVLDQDSNESNTTLSSSTNKSSFYEIKDGYILFYKNNSLTSKYEAIISINKYKLENSLKVNELYYNLGLINNSDSNFTEKDDPKFFKELLDQFNLMNNI